MHVGGEVEIKDFYKKKFPGIRDAWSVAKST